jgi:hypothetical protein
MPNNHKLEKENDDENKLKGFFMKAIPIMPKPLAIICLFFNILIPGLGMLILFYYCLI